jgi:hypothetical protein
MVREIQIKGLVKLGGRTPTNTVYSRLSQDPRFVNVARGAYALATVVNGGGTWPLVPLLFPDSRRPFPHCLPVVHQYPTIIRVCTSTP